MLDIKLRGKYKPVCNFDYYVLLYLEYQNK